MRLINTLILAALIVNQLSAQSQLKKVKLKNKNISTQEVYLVIEGTDIKNGLYEKQFMGQTKAKGNYLNNQRDGKWIFTNYIIIEGNYNAGKMVGKWIYKKQTDTLSILNFENGEIDGPQLGYFENGRIASKTNYKEGKKDGEQVFFYSNGNLKEKSIYKDGTIDGSQIIYSEDGKSINKITYFKNNPISFETIKGKNKLADYKENLVNGTGKLELLSQDQEGNAIVIMERNFKDSLLHGSINGFNILGNKTFEGQYKNGYMIGEWKFYNYKGELDHTKTYHFIDSIERDTAEISTMNYSEKFFIVENMPEFPGGDKYLREIIGKNIKYPKECLANGIKGRVFVQFVVNLVGEVEKVKVVKSVHPLLDKEAIRVVKELPNWVPGFQSGSPVKVSFTVPINFNFN